MTDQLQRQAASPERSVFVSANAGTGKTKVLIERVLRLLLCGEVPETILCVTFTRAAAAEIQARLHRKLAQWAVAQQSELINDIKGITGQLPAQEMIEVARRLFAKVIDNDQGPRIETTHSFCQSLLSRFPIEAGLPPHFELITEAQKDTLLRVGFSSAFQEPAREMKQALEHLIAISDHKSLFDHVKSFVAARKLSDAAIATPLGFVPKFETAMRDILPAEIAVDDLAVPDVAIKKHFVVRLSQIPYRDLADALPEKLRPFLEWNKLADAEKADRLDTISPIFLTTKGEPRKGFVTQKLGSENPALHEIYQRLADCMIAYHKAQTALATVERSRALYVLGRHVAQSYERAKLRLAVLDYDDLIIKADKLLGASEAMAWVRWKLDFGIHHMLVDEAQDTNPAQWELLASLADEFFMHEADKDNPRTLFSVGDFKQSIYSFQGANPHIFVDKGIQFEAQANQSHHLFSDVKLAMSFRSSKAVLDMVNHVMSLEEVAGLGGTYLPHEAFFKEKFGMVELWPIEEESQKPPELPYFDVADFVSEDETTRFGPDALLADKIAKHILTMLNGSAKGLDGRRYQPRDIMILVNKRDSIFHLLRGALLRHNIPVAGADRVRLDRQIEIMDLMALGDVCLLAEDDLQLACVLKSPLIGLDEADLMSLAAHRKPKSALIAALKAQAGAENHLGQAVAKLEHYFALANALSPAAFYQSLLAQGGRDAFYKRLGAGVADSLNAFIDQAFEFEAKGGASLADFLAHQRAYKTEIKRDFGNIQENQVRIMTIHGAKGLESPIVYVPDIVKGIEPADTLIAADDALYWPADSNFMPDKIAEHKQAGKDARAAEHQRLLYVAMTRASECLFLAGFQKSRSSKQGISWDQLLQAGFEAAQILPDEDGVYRYRHKGSATKDKTGNTAKHDERVPDDIKTRYGWAFCPPVADDIPIKPLIPSAPDQSDLPEPLAKVPNTTAAKAQDHARLEGIFMHELLELLSHIPADERHDVAMRHASRSLIANSPAKNPIGRDRLAALALHMVDFMKTPEFAPLFGTEALTEFGISGIVGHRPVVGQIDKLLISEDSLWLVDFKSGQPYHHNVPEAYQYQLALYAALLADIYPDKAIKAEIIWLRDFSRTALSQDELASVLARS